MALYQRHKSRKQRNLGVLMNRRIEKGKTASHNSLLYDIVAISSDHYAAPEVRHGRIEHILRKAGHIK